MFQSALSRCPFCRRPSRVVFRPAVEQLESRIAPASVLSIQDPPAGVFPQIAFLDPHPTSGGDFGAGVVVLSTGNVVITNPNDNAGGADAGAVYLFNGLTGALISALTGSSAGDSVGSGGVVALTNGNFVVASPNWSNGTMVDVGAATWGSGFSGVSGPVSASNSIVGSTANDQVSQTGVTPLSNGNFVVTSPSWTNGASAGAGAATWGNGNTGQSATGFGAVSPANSIVGSHTGDSIGGGRLAALTNGNFVFTSSSWTNGAVSTAGAATWLNGLTGQSATGFGAVSVSNSIVGSNTGDDVGAELTALTNGNFLIGSPFWSNAGVANAGAATWGNGTTGQTATGFGAVSTANSIVGSTMNDDIGGVLWPLANGNFVTTSSSWTNGLMADAGAATWGNGTTGQSATGFGPVSVANSIVGTAAGDAVGSGVDTALTNGNFVIGSQGWDNGAVTRAGAATWLNGATGQSATGFGGVSVSNSIVGTTSGDAVGDNGITALTNGNFVVQSLNWSNGMGAATWGNGVTGQSATGFGPVSVANSIVGAVAGDEVAGDGVFALTNGNFVIASPGADAATWGNGTTGQSATGFGAVSSANSIVGPGVGLFVVPLTNGNFVVTSEAWQNGTLVNAGAATWGNGTTGQSATGFGAVSPANSIVGTTADEFVGMNAVALSDGNFVVISPHWKNGALVDAGAETWGNGTNGQTLDGNSFITAQNSLIGQSANSGLKSFNPLGLVPNLDDAPNHSFLAAFTTENNSGVVVSGFTDPNLLTYARGGTQTISVTPAFVAGPLTMGTAVTLQATTTLNVVSSILGGNANLNLQAANITLVSGVTVATGSGSADFSSGILTLGGIVAGSATIAGNLGFTGTLTYQVRLDGATPGSGYDQLIVTGGVNLGGATLSVTLGFTPSAGETFTIIDNRGSGTVVGTFAGLPEGTVFTSNGQRYQISYRGGDGNDVVLTFIPSPVPPPPVAVSIIAVGADAGGGPEVNVYNAATGQLVASFYAFTPTFTGGVRVAVADINGDGTPDIICSAGPGGGPEVEIINGTKLGQTQANGEIAASALLSSFYAFTPTFTGGVFVGAAVSTSGQREIVVGADAGGGPQVAIIDATKIRLQSNGQIATSALLANFFAFDPTFTGGVRVALGDVNGDGTLDVIAGAGPGGGPQVVLIDGTKLNQLQGNAQIADAALISSFYALRSSFTGGVYVSSDAEGRVVVGGAVATTYDIFPVGPTLTPVGSEFSIYDSQGTLQHTTLVYPAFLGGVRVGSVAAGGQSAILTGAGPGGLPQVESYDAATLNPLSNFFALPQTFSGGVFVAGG